MESKPTNIEELFEKLKEYADVRLNLFKLKSINKVAGFMSSAITSVILIILFGSVLLCSMSGLHFSLADGLERYIGDFLLLEQFILLSG